MVIDKGPTYKGSLKFKKTESMDWRLKFFKSTLKRLQLDRHRPKPSHIVFTQLVLALPNYHFEWCQENLAKRDIKRNLISIEVP